MEKTNVMRILDQKKISAGKIGYQVEVAPMDLKKVVPYEFNDVVSGAE